MLIRIRIRVRKVLEKVKEGIKKQGKILKEEIEDIKKELKEQAERGRVERNELRSSIEGLEKRIKESWKKKRRRRRKWRTESGGEVEKKVMEIERKMEMREREEKKQNVIIRGLEVKQGTRIEAVEGILKDIGARVNVEDVKRIGGDKEEGREMVRVKLSNEEQRGEVMRMKKNLKGRKERIAEDWTWKKRKMRWKMEVIAREEEKKGVNVWIGYGKMRIGEKWWRWDESEEVLVDGSGKVREVFSRE